ncbi:MAG: hypothetical protein VB071_10250 [Lawsonibacter sp.]|nr:hypothetical protein [Lawsonibacter sp.]
MNEKHKRGKNVFEMLGMVVLIVVLAFASQMVFQGLGAMIPRREAGSFTTLNRADGELGAYGLRPLESEERQAADIQGWLGSAREWVSGENSTQEYSTFWLYRQDTDEYVLYLPDQDRTLSAADFTADEERDQDGEITLTLRARTPEGGEKAVPEEQLFSLQTRSEEWRGIRVKLVLEGRERHVYKMTSRGDRLYSADEMYIGRDR